MTSISISLRLDVLISVVSQPSWNKVLQWLHFLEKQLTIFITDASYGIKKVWTVWEVMMQRLNEGKSVYHNCCSFSFFLSFFLQGFSVPEQLFFNPAHTILPHPAVKFQCSFVKVCKGLSYKSFDRQAFSTLSFTWLTNHNVSSIHV